MRLELLPITRHNFVELCGLDAGDCGKQVASNQRSMAQAAVYPEAWPRAIVVNDQMVGFLMLNDPSLYAEPEVKQYYLWRLMVDKAQQGKGYGRAAVLALIEHVRARPDATALTLSFVQDAPGAAGVERFYRSLGFLPTGEIDDGEVVMRLAFA